MSYFLKFAERGERHWQYCLNPLTEQPREFDSYELAESWAKLSYGYPLRGRGYFNQGPLKYKIKEGNQI